MGAISHSLHRVPDAAMKMPLMLSLSEVFICRKPHFHFSMMPMRQAAPIFGSSKMQSSFWVIYGVRSIAASCASPLSRASMLHDFDAGEKIYVALDKKWNL